MRPMSHHLLALVALGLSLTACKGDDTADKDTDAANDSATDTPSESGADTPVDTPNDTPVGQDTAPTDTTPVDTGGARPLDQIWFHVVSTVSLQPSSQGFDLDGDGTADNKLGDLASLINPMIQSSFGTVPEVAIVQTWGVNDGDVVVDIGIVTGRDLDGNVLDNFSGTELFSPTSGFGPTGRALLRSPTTLDAFGGYLTTLPVGPIQLGPFALTTATGSVFQGFTSDASHTGTFGTAVSVTELQTVLSSFGVSAGLTGLVAALADIDSDSNGSLDSVSMSFAFTAVPCAIQVPGMP